jgi:hypothetical protein
VRSLLASFAIVAVLAATSRAQQTIPPHPTLPECEQDDPTLVKPDLIPEVPSNVRTLFQGNDRQLQFTTSVGNVGPGPLILEGITVSTADGVFTAAYQHISRTDGSQCAHTAGLFVYHPQHKHWHFDRFVGYELRRDDPYSGELVGGGEKMSFCLLDIQPLRGFNPMQHPRQLTNLTCHSAEGLYGISVGWEDVYERFLPGQSIDLDPDPEHQVPQGSYFLVNKVNPDGRIWETNLDNNTSFTSVGVSLPAPVLAAVPPPTPTPGPAKNPQLPHLRPGRIRPTRVPRAPRPGTQFTPTPMPPVEAQPTPVPTAVSAPARGPHAPHTPTGPHRLM